MQTGELKSLTSPRGAAAFAVVLQHFSATAQEYCSVAIPSLIPHGYVAVEFFFILSGVEFAAYLLFPAFLAAMVGARWSAWGAVAVSTAYLSAVALTHPRPAIGGEGPPESLLRCFAEFTLRIAAYLMLQSPGLCALLRRVGITIGLSLAASASLVARYDLPAVMLFPFVVVAYATSQGITARIVQMRPVYFMGMQRCPSLFWALAA